jgi:hypothetical protein
MIGLERLDPSRAHLLEESLPHVQCDWYTLSFLGEDRISVLKVARALELDRRRRAEEARRVFLEISVR